MAAQRGPAAAALQLRLQCLLALAQGAAQVHQMGVVDRQ